MFNLSIIAHSLVCCFQSELTNQSDSETGETDAFSDDVLSTSVLFPPRFNWPVNFSASNHNIFAFSVIDPLASSQSPSMDPTQTSLSFSYAVSTFEVLERNFIAAQAKTSEFLLILFNETMLLYDCKISFSLPEPNYTYNNGKHEFKYSIIIVGSYSNKLITIKTNRRFMLRENGEMGLFLKRHLNDIMQSTCTQITCLGYDKITAQPPGLANDNMEIEILGQWDAIEKARILCLVLFDELAGLRVDKVDIDHRIHYLIAGRKKSAIDKIMHQTMTNIYIPAPFLAQLGSQRSSQQSEILLDFNVNTIYITGDFEGVQQARDTLLTIASALPNNVITKQINCQSLKIDWLLSTKRDVLVKVMFDNGTFLLLPSLGSNENILSIMGVDRVYIERTARSLMILICEFYASSIHTEQNLLRVPQLNHILGQICQESAAEVIVQMQTIEIYGPKIAVKSAFTRMVELDFVKASIGDTTFQVELAHEHKEFINGKKNGKINKITKSSNCKITFQENFNEFNMLIDIINSIPLKSLEGLLLLEDELPAEKSFYVPESFHKRIIGVGGKNIQRIMKKFGVYVKFSNAEEFAALGGYYENVDNVIARTPAKNSANLEQLKQSIFELVNFKSDVRSTLQIPRIHHRIVIGLQASQLFDIQNSTKVTITFPEKELGSDDVLIEGPESQVQQAKNLLLEKTPIITDIQIPSSQHATFLILSHEFHIAVRQRILREHKISLYVLNPPPEDASSECKFMLHHLRGNQSVEVARKIILDFLVANQVPLAMSQNPNISKPGLFTNLPVNASFQHFNSKLLAPVTTESLKVSTSGYSLFDKPGNAFGPQGSGFLLNPKATLSVPNLRQLFEDVSLATTESFTMPRTRSDVNDLIRMPQNSLDQSYISSTMAATSYDPHVYVQDKWNPGGSKLAKTNSESQNSLYGSINRPLQTSENPTAYLSQRMDQRFQTNDTAFR
ncbi:hypothetical protein HK096_008442, partial [Nowakowskiella sp. JEL0078]